MLSRTSAKSKMFLSKQLVIKLSPSDSPGHFPLDLGPNSPPVPRVTALTSLITALSAQSRYAWTQTHNKLQHSTAVLHKSQIRCYSFDCVKSLVAQKPAADVRLTHPLVSSEREQAACSAARSWVCLAASPAATACHFNLPIHNPGEESSLHLNAILG